MRMPVKRLSCHAYASAHTIGQQGVTYLAVLIAIAVIGLALAAAGTVWHQSVRREKEAELLHVGHQFRDAIKRYYLRSPGTLKRYPQQLQDLLQDNRFVSTQRYLRKLYRDPITGKGEWGTVRTTDGGIVGVYSLSEDVPIKIGGFIEADRAFSGAQSYADWKFLYQPAGAPLPLAGNQAKP
jgi:type II secretory pathway pseudopilin PulG